jgi:protein involved in polysaccharide export with SLBB domain
VQAQDGADASSDIPAKSQKTARDVDALIHLGDLIDVDIVGSTEFDWRGEVSPEGFLSAFRFSEDGIFALCQTQDDVAGLVREAYSRFLNDPKVVVSILDKSGRLPAVVFGAVRNQQRYKLLRYVNLAEILVRSGGLTGNASGEVKILRQPGANCVGSEPGKDSPEGAKTVGSSLTFKVKVADLIAGVPSANPEIVFGDIITVEESPPVYVMGGIGTPSRIPYREGLSLSRAVASSGGLSKGADGNRITIFRRIKGRSEVIKASLEKIDEGTDADIALAAYDIVDVAQKGGSERRFAPVPEDEAQTRRPEALPLRLID